MKKLFSVVIFILFFCASSYSQTEKGRFVFSGATNVNLLFSNLDPETRDVVDQKVDAQDYSVKAGVGYFIFDNFSVNITGSYEYAYSKQQLFLGAYPGDNHPVYLEDIQKTFAIIPAVTYYFPVEGKLKPNISFGAGYMTLQEKNSQSASADNIVYHFGGLSLNGSAGASYFFTHNFSADLGFQYSRNKLNDKTNNHLSQLQKMYGVMAGLSVYF